MKSLALTLLLCAALPVLAGDFPAGSPNFGKSLATATADAVKSGKPVVLVFSSVTCANCQQMKREVYPSEAVKAFHDKFEWAYLDFDDHANDKAKAEYGVAVIPHIQFLSKDGQDIGSQTGSTSPEDFANTLEMVLRKAARTAAIKN